MIDKNRFRPTFDSPEEENVYYDWKEQKHPKSSTSAKKNNAITKKELFGMGKNVVKNAGTGYAGCLATHFSRPSKVVFNRQMERVGQYLLIPSSKLAKGIPATGAIIGLGLNTLEDGIKNYFWDEK